MTPDDLLKIANDAVRRSGRSAEFADRIIVCAVVSALRDEIVPQHWKMTELSTVSAHDLRRFFNEILGSDAVEAAGGPTSNDGPDEVILASSPTPAADEYTLCRACGHPYIATTKPPEELP